MMQSPDNARTLEVQRQANLLATFGVVAILVLVVISVVNAYQMSYAFVPFTVGFALAIVVCIALMYSFGWLRLTMHAYGVLMILLTVEMIVSGGVAGNGFLWLFILPPVCFFLMGPKLGGAYMFTIVITVLILFFVPTLARISYAYSWAFKFRFLLAFLGCAGVSLASEISRCRYSKRYHDALEDLELATVTDPLTGLLNRRGGVLRLEHCSALTKRNKLTYSVLMVDIDHFKRVNDTYGHSTGDTVLKELASIFTKGLRNQDYGIRWGGEEFLFLLPNTDLSGALQVADKLRSSMKEKQIATSNGSLSVTCSVGVAEIGEAESYEQAIARADALLYKAKQNGRDRVEG